MAKHKIERSVEKSTPPYSILREDEVNGQWIRDDHFTMFLATMCRRAHNAIRDSKSEFRADGNVYKIEDFKIRGRDRRGICLPVSSEFPYKTLVRESISEGKYEDILVSETKDIKINLYILPNNPVDNPDGTPALARGDFRISIEFARPIFIRTIDRGYGPEPVKTTGMPMDLMGKCGFSSKGPYALLFNQQVRSEQLLMINLMKDGLVTGDTLIKKGYTTMPVINTFLEDGVITQEQAFGPTGGIQTEETLTTGEVTIS